MIRLFFISIICLVYSWNAKAQVKFDDVEFFRFVAKNYRHPEVLKSNCEWTYAIIKLKVNAGNKVVGYEFINSLPDLMKHNLSFLKGYQFPKQMKINNHPLVFYLAIDNIDGCTEKPGDKIFYPPNQPASIIWGYIGELLRKDPQTIIMPTVVICSYATPAK